MRLKGPGRFKAAGITRQKAVSSYKVFLSEGRKVDSDFDLLKKRLRDLVSCHKELNDALSEDPVAGIGLLDLERIVTRVKEGENIPSTEMQQDMSGLNKPLAKTGGEDKS